MRRWLSTFRRKEVAPAATDFAALLGRSQVNLDTPELQRFLAQKVVLITGAGGSIGSEICRQMMRFCPARIILIDRAENALFEIDRELREAWLGADIVPLVADIGDTARIEMIFRTLRPQVVFHAAAHKHVPMMEANPGEAIKNNVVGTKILADAAAETGVEAFVMISTDKAVNPTSVMGASKRVAELYVQSKNGECQMSNAESKREDQAANLASQFESRHSTSGIPATRFVAVRFGNVLGSSGSVVPIFQKQIAAGGPVTVTHPEMQRYFMTIPEAAQLVMQAGAIGNGGEIFVLDMGQPLKILDVAKEMIRAAGLRVHEDIQIDITGVRPGEKLFEELAGDSETTKPTAHERIRVWQLPRASRREAEQMIEQLVATINRPRVEVIAALCDCVPEYQPDTKSDHVDVVYQSGPEDQATALRRLAAQAA